MVALGIAVVATTATPATPAITTAATIIAIVVVVVVVVVAVTLLVKAGMSIWKKELLTIVRKLDLSHLCFSLNFYFLMFLRNFLLCSPLLTYSQSFPYLLTT